MKETFNVCLYNFRRKKKKKQNPQNFQALRAQLEALDSPRPRPKWRVSEFVRMDKILLNRI